MHPFSRAQEWSCVLNAAKMEQIFSKPFIASLEGHFDSMGVLVKSEEALFSECHGEQVALVMAGAHYGVPKSPMVF